MANQIASEAQADLDKAMPELDAATEALKTLKKSDIDEIKAYKTPPEAIQTVLGVPPVLRSGDYFRYCLQFVGGVPGEGSLCFSVLRRSDVRKQVRRFLFVFRGGADSAEEAPHLGRGEEVDGRFQFPQRAAELQQGMAQ